MKIFKLLPLLILISLSLSCSHFLSKGEEKKTNKENLTVFLRDGVFLDAIKFYPVDSVPKEGFPVIIFCHGFGRSKNDMIQYAEAQARNGYYTFTYSMRGQGLSGGKSNFLSTVEMEDLNEIIDWIKKDSLINSQKIGIAGSSQGGIIPFMSAAYGKDIQCIVSNLATPDFASSWINNDCINMTLLWSLNYGPENVRYSDEAIKFRNWILSGEADKFDSLKMLFPAGRDFMDKVGNVTVPVFISNSWQDKFFTSNGMREMNDKLLSPKLIYIGASGGHGSDNSDEGHKFVSQNLERWFDHYLKGIDNDVEKISPYVYALSSYPFNDGKWSYSHYITNNEPEKKESLKFYFTPENKLSMNPVSEIGKLNFNNEITDTSFKLSDALIMEFTGEEFNKKFIKNEIVFESAALNESYSMFGSPLVNFNYSSNSDVVQFNFQIWEVTPDGNMNFITRINYTDWHNKSHEEKSKLIKGNSHGHTFQKGNKIRIVLTNLDTTPDDTFLRTNPYVLPVVKNSNSIIYFNNNNPAYIEIPLIVNGE